MCADTVIPSRLSIIHSHSDTSVQEKLGMLARVPAIPPSPTDPTQATLFGDALAVIINSLAQEPEPIPGLMEALQVRARGALVYLHLSSPIVVTLGSLFALTCPLFL